ncbi:uncharacterized protein K489DRAFT_317968 [Dissoconium aciculare CBS 342.82]|uniref:Phenylacetaldoxime dehydratase n=1 Tax=Dissoconium aciculare CBS 342.82 TaxID=1314786 RepID=A0A6J3M6N3_9PEZI|nr:uncharacterized protein K489DRAFT_317968 [Dissoconium aciculare CBS 342.82]KAF1823670.1 hypothetical protein K489DRAFT_317968 [Dissoconium aciculare CBS 342.82]
MATARSNGRTHPLKKPSGHRPPVPRWTLKLPDGVSRIHTIYVGVQSHSSSSGAAGASRAGEDAIAAILAGSRAAATDTFRVTHGFDLAGARVWAAYFTDGGGYEAALEELDLVRVWGGLGADKAQVGLWLETFSAPAARLETNYSRLEHRPGLARLPGAEQPAHELTAYWGAGRDRIPASAHDLFPPPPEGNLPKRPAPPPEGLGQRVHGRNRFDNICHIRSGQHWAGCGEEERRAYEGDLQGALMEGMEYLWSHAEETGTLGLRFLRNLDDQGEMVRETCGAGFFRNWADLERWSSRHASHLRIFNGAMAHAKRFGEGRRLMTWHEVCILKEGEGRFEYVNCDGGTGVMRWVELEVEDLQTK